MRRLAIVALLLILALPEPALGGGVTAMRSPDEFIEPGETVEMVAYENVPLAQVSEGPWVAFLGLEPTTDSVEPQWLRLGEVEITPVRWSGYGTHRVYLTFKVPADLAVGIYGVGIFNEAGDSLEWVSGWIKVGLPVGQEEAHYDWPLDEPLVAKLPFWATLTPIWPSGVLVKDLRAGRYPLDAAQYLLDPSILDDPGITLVAPTTTTVPEPTTTPAPVTTAPTATQAAPASPSTTGAVPGAVPIDDSIVVPTVITVLLMLIGVTGLVWLAARGRKVHVVLGGRPETTPLPADSSERVDDNVSADNQTRR